MKDTTVIERRVILNDQVGARRRRDGVVEVNGWPRPHVGNPTFLSDEASDWKEENSATKTTSGLNSERRPHDMNN